MRRYSRPSAALTVGGTAALALLLAAGAAFAADAPAGQPAPATPPAATPHPPSNLEALDPDTAMGILGEKVLGPAAENLGLVTNVLVDADGHPRAVVIDFGGFLGVGSRKIAVDWQLLSFKLVDAKPVIVLALGRDELQAAPEYKPPAKPGDITQMVGPPPSVVATPPSDKRE